MSLSISQVTVSQIPALHQILVECGLDLQKRCNLCYWVPPYPLEKMLKDARNMDLYAIKLDSELIGTFTIETKMPSGYLKYGNINWQNPGLSAFYMHRLAVLPLFQAKGIGTWCLQQIENLAINRNYSAVRLDAVKTNQKLLKFYEKSGYKKVGEIIFNPEDKYEDAFVFEKVVA
ncbi:acetyltransferase [Rivularia sp. PCC 7116]|uniref:GNAT family N-acetyltransferase n=1 Tax=Rivularia sp. PCC 7116 TaxID=373994 RepID=UPI00029EDF90|nr:GNAT family N-acetyltransferase [Rivularia sp. PCC 7116]AFY55977.1 acetyltransferase [Rivularia sp. PCC 7116]